jgi:hypothetical protein
MKKIISLFIVLLSTSVFSQDLELVLSKSFIGDTLGGSNNITLMEIKNLNFTECPCYNELVINSNLISLSSICNNTNYSYNLKFVNQGNQYTCFNQRGDYMVTYMLIRDGDEFYLIEYQPFDSYKSYVVWLCKKKGD